MPKSVMVQIVSSVVVVLSVIHQVQSFKLQRAFQLRPHTVLFSGDAVEKLNLEPIARIAGEVRLSSQYLPDDETSMIVFCNVTNYYHSLCRLPFLEVNLYQTEFFF
jgi:hypothetical protein